MAKTKKKVAHEKLFPQRWVNEPAPVFRKRLAFEALDLSDLKEQKTAIFADTNNKHPFAYQVKDGRDILGIIVPVELMQDSVHRLADKQQELGTCEHLDNIFLLHSRLSNTAYDRDKQGSFLVYQKRSGEPDQVFGFFTFGQLQVLKKNEALPASLAGIERPIFSETAAQKTARAAFTPVSESAFPSSITAKPVRKRSAGSMAYKSEVVTNDIRAHWTDVEVMVNARDKEVPVMCRDDLLSYLVSENHLDEYKALPDVNVIDISVGDFRKNITQMHKTLKSNQLYVVSGFRSGHSIGWIHPLLLSRKGEQNLHEKPVVIPAEDFTAASAPQESAIPENIPEPPLSPSIQQSSLTATYILQYFSGKVAERLNEEGEERSIYRRKDLIAHLVPSKKIDAYQNIEGVCGEKLDETSFRRNFSAISKNLKENQVIVVGDGASENRVALIHPALFERAKGQASMPAVSADLQEAVSEGIDAGILSERIFNSLSNGGYKEEQTSEGKCIGIITDQQTLSDIRTLRRTLKSLNI